MAGVRFVPEAEDLTPSGSSNTMFGTGGPRATLHCTVSHTTQFEDMHRVLTDGAREPHLLYSFADDRLGQYFALDRSARALLGPPDVPVSHNRSGTVNIQIEVVARTDDWTRRDDWRPGPNFKAMLRAIRSWGIDNRLVFRFAQNSGDRPNVARPASMLSSDAGGGCWWGHCHYPRPSDPSKVHWDPGRVDMARFFAAADQSPAPVGLFTEEDDMKFDDKVPLTSTERQVWDIQSLSVGEALKSAVYARRFANEAKKDAAAALEIVKTMAAMQGVSDEAIVEADTRGRANAPDDVIADDLLFPVDPVEPIQ
jgi:hypothetical protein